MKLSTKGRYGLRALAELALHFDENMPVPLASIAQKQRLSVKYLENMFSTLKKAGVIHSVKGLGGGYLLARPASDITVGEALRLLEGDLSIADTDGFIMNENSLSAFIKQNVWDVVTSKINSVVDSVSLDDLIHCRLE